MKRHRQRHDPSNLGPWRSQRTTLGFPAGPLVSLWAAPAAWATLAVVLVRLGRVDGVEAASAAVVVLVGVGLARAVAGWRGGLLGRLAELVLLGGAVGWTLAEPLAHRVVVGLAVGLVAAALTMAGLWPRASLAVQQRLAAVAGSLVGIVVATGVVGASRWPLKALLVVAASTLVAALLARTAGPLIAAAAAVALGVSVGPAHTAGWLLPLLVAAVLLALARGRPWLAAVAGAAAAFLPPAGLAVSAGSLVAAARRRRSPAPLMLALPVLLVAWWRLPSGLHLIGGWQWEAAATALPLSATALPFLLPLAVLGLSARRPAVGEGRDLLAIGLLVLPMVGAGPWTGGAAAALWLAALPAAASLAPRLRAVSLPWTLGASLALLLSAPWGVVVPLAGAAALLTGGWAVATLLSLSRWRVARLAWLLPLAGLVWTVPVEGVDHHLAVGQELRLPAPASGGWVVMAESADPTLSPGQPLVEAVDSHHGALLTGRDAPVAGAPAHHPMAVLGGHGRAARVTVSGVSRHAVLRPVTVRARAPAVLRFEAAERWRQRRNRLVGLVGGALLLLALGGALPGSRERAFELGLALAIGGLLAAGSGIAPLARPAFREAPDLALAMFLAAVASVWPLLSRWRLAAGVALLAPLALAQPLLRGPAGDEVYHLKLAESMVADHDLDITNNVDRRVASQAMYLREGRRLIHSPALAILVLPAFMLLGWEGALLVTALLVAAAAAITARRACELGARQRAVWLAWGLVIASYPAVTFATQLWPAALGMAAAALVLAAAARPSPAAAVGVTVVALLVKVRLLLITGPVAAVAVLRRRRTLRLIAAAGLLAAAALAVTAILGGPLGRHHLAELLPSTAWAPLVAAWGLAWDAAGGLAFSAPLWLVALAGMAAVWRRGGAGERALIAGAALTLAALLPRAEWYGGGSPPARYLVPLLPLVQLALVEVVGTARGRRLVRLAMPWAAVAAWVAVTRPLWWFNPGDGGWWLADGLARALGANARRVFPALLRPSPAAVIVPVMLLGIAMWWRARPRDGAAALALLGLILALTWIRGTPETRVDLEDPQVHHLAGVADPPPGSFFRAAHPISWRLAPGQGIETPWNPPLGRRLVARVRVAGAGQGTLLAAWAGEAVVPVPVSGGGWRSVGLPEPPALGRGRLRLEWRGAPGTAVLLDRVEVRP